MNTEESKALFENKNIAITGGLGSIGAEIVRNLVDKNINSITIIDNRETELANLIFENSDERIHFIFADIRESDKMIDAINGIDIVFHAAAMKHVGVCESNPFEGVKTNVIGTQNIIQACLKNNVEKMLLISTDKAVNPTNVMGATKLLAERLVSACSHDTNHITKFGVVRFGNVSYSRGSVLEIWDNCVHHKKKIPITDPGMTRFFMDVNQAIGLMFEAMKYTEFGETFILKMPSIRMRDLLRIYLEIHNLPDTFYTIIGKRVGEKQHEELVSAEESGCILENDILLLMPPLLYRDNIDQYQKNGFVRSHKTYYGSKEKSILLNDEQIRNMLLHLKALNKKKTNKSSLK